MVKSQNNKDGYKKNESSGSKSNTDDKGSGKNVSVWQKRKESFDEKKKNKTPKHIVATRSIGGKKVGNAVLTIESRNEQIFGLDANKKRTYAEVLKCNVERLTSGKHSNNIGFAYLVFCA